MSRRRCRRLFVSLQDLWPISGDCRRRRPPRLARRPQNKWTSRLHVDSMERNGRRLAQSDTELTGRATQANLITVKSSSSTTKTTTTTTTTNLALNLYVNTQSGCLDNSEGRRSSAPNGQATSKRWLRFRPSLFANSADKRIVANGNRRGRSNWLSVGGGGGGGRFQFCLSLLCVCN